MFGWSVKKRVDRSHSIKLKKEQMAKLATIAEAYDQDTNECIGNLIDGFFSSPHSEVGKHVQQTMVTGANAQAQAQIASNPLIQMFQQLPPEVQNQLVQKVVGGLTGGKKDSMGF